MTRQWILTVLLASPLRCDDHVRVAAAVEKNMLRGTIYQGGSEVTVCTPWLKIVFDVGVMCL